MIDPEALEGVSPEERAALRTSLLAMAAPQDFHAFTRLCVIRHRDGATKETWIGSMDPAWDAHLAEFDRALIAREDVNVLKARQEGFSWRIVAFALWRQMFHALLPALFFSQGEAEAIALVERALFIYEHVPQSLRAKAPLLKRPTQTEMLFDKGDRGAGIIAMPSTEKAGRSLVADLAVFDEFSSHEYAQQNFSAVEPMASQVVKISTATAPENFFAKGWWAAWRKESGETAIFVPWNAIPGRDLVWYERTKAKWVGFPDDFYHEFPATPEEAFTVRSGLVYPMFSASTHVLSRDPFSWDNAVVRVAGVDWGGGHPTAAILLGLDRGGGIHQFHEFYDRTGTAGVSTVGDWLNSYGPLHAVVCDRSNAVAINELRSGGLNAVPSESGRRAGLNLVAELLSQKRLTLSDRNQESIAEFPSYRWPTRVDPNAKDRYRTNTPVDHHGDAMDARRYACVWLIDATETFQGPVIQDVNTRRATSAV